MLVFSGQEHAMNANIDVYLEILQEMKEDDLSKNIIVPLFKAMGCSRVDFHGGPYENGKDIIAHYETAFEDHLYVVQTKKIGDGKATSDKEVLGKLIFQLIQCYYNDIPTIDGKRKKPNAVYFATPFKINSRLIAEIHGFLNNSNNPVKLLDGPLIISELKKYKPELLNSLLKIEKKILIQDKNQLVNLELMAALSQENSIHEIHYYNDLAFFMGAIDSNILIKSEFRINSEIIQYSKEQWDSFKVKYLNKLENYFSRNPLNETVDEIEKEYIKSLESYKSIENEQRLQEIAKHNSEINSLINTLENIKSDVMTFSNAKNIQDNTKLKSIIDDWFNFVHKGVRISDVLETKKNLETLNAFADDKITTKNFSILFKNYHITLKMLAEEHEQQTAIYQSYVHPPLVNFSFDSNCIEDWLELNQRKYAKSIEDINSDQSTDLDTLRVFLDTTKKTLAVLEILKELSENTTMSIQLNRKHSDLKDGISITPFTLFNTDHDIAVYGGAGAGKTTTLQMYAKKLLDENKNIVIYLPLNRLINKKSINLSITKAEDAGHKEVLALILISKEMEDSYENIDSLDASLKNSGKLKLIIDGLDEAYTKTPYIIKSINAFKERYPKIQLIISSRDCVSYLSEINFLGVTLLPFTTKQLDDFINAWFHNAPSVALSLIEDINKNSLKEIVKTPLLATLLCILKDKGIDTPSTEMEIFTRRLNLLCGEYDNYKIIKRTKFDSHILEKAAMKIGFHLHNKNKRTETKEGIISFLVNDSTFTYNKSACQLIVEELINPCNILYYDSLTDSYSLGHLRFQEHLAALEINDNRGREITPLLDKDWWMGPLCLYAQTCEISSLIEEYCKQYGKISPAIKVLKEMINNRPVSERQHLNHLLFQYKKTDVMDEMLGLDNSEDDFDDWRYVKANGFSW